MISNIVSRLLQFPVVGKLRASAATPLFQALLVRNRSYRIPFGPLRGEKLLYSNGVSLQELMGLMDFRQIQLLGRLMSSYFSGINELVVVDAGANVGLYSMWFSKIFKNRIRKIYAFEPAPSTAANLKRNLSNNGLNRVEVTTAALADSVGELEFVASGDPHTAHLKLDSHDEANLLSPRSFVSTTTLDSFFADKEHALPHLLKIDIEGGAALALRAATTVLKNRPLIFIESHNHEEDRAIQTLIFDHRYVAFRLNDEKWVSCPKEIHPSRHGVWGRLVLIPIEKLELALPVLKEKIDSKK